MNFYRSNDPDPATRQDKTRKQIAALFRLGYRLGNAGIAAGSAPGLDTL